jgi:hypothetical protein
MLDWNLIAIYSSPILSGIILFLIKKHYEGEVRLVASYIHASAVPISNSTNEKPTSVGVHVLVLKNQGKLSATDVRLGHNFLPAFSIYPSTDYTTKKLDDHSYEIIIKIIVPKEQLTITYVYDCEQITIDRINTYIKHATGFAEKIYNVLYIKPLSFLKKTIILALLFIGIATMIYGIIYLIIFLPISLKIL